MPFTGRVWSNLTAVDWARAARVRAIATSRPRPARAALARITGSAPPVPALLKFVAFIVQAVVRVPASSSRRAVLAGRPRLPPPDTEESVARGCKKPSGERPERLETRWWSVRGSGEFQSKPFELATTSGAATLDSVIRTTGERNGRVN